MAYTLRRLAITLVVTLMAVTFLAGSGVAQQAANPPAQGGDQTMQSAQPAPADEKPAKKKKKAKANKKTSKKKAQKKAEAASDTEKKQ